MIGNPDTFAFDLSLDPSHELANLGWGSLKILINREVVWDAEWTWLDLAEWFASYWKFIIYEICPHHPLDEDNSFRYHARHNMAYGMKGIYLPTLYLFPTSTHMATSYQKFHCSRLPLENFQEVVEEFVAIVLEACSEDQTGRRREAFQKWEKRRRYEI